MKLSDRDKSPDKIKRQLDTDNVAESIKDPKNKEYFPWGPH